MQGYIYKVTNIVNGKQYVGKRSRDYRNDYDYIGSGTILLRARSKYGRENFVKEIIEECDTLEELNSREEYWIDFYNAVEDPNFYNLTPKANGSAKGSKRSEETKKKISESLTGKPLSDDHKKSISYSLTGRHLSEDTKQKLSDTLTGRKMPDWFSSFISEAKKGNTNFLGKHHTEESKKKISDAKRGVPFSDEHKKHLSESKKGTKFSEEARRNMSEARKRDGVRPPDNTGKIVVNNGLVNRRIYPYEFPKFESMGFVKGFKKKRGDLNEESC